MSGPMLSVFVAGRPQTQGSKKGYVRGGRAVIVDAKPEALRSWRERICSTVYDRINQRDVWVPFTGPVHVRLVFTLAKPASAPKRRRVWPIGSRSGDLDKLTRAVFDAITDAGFWRDDSQAVELTASKDYPPTLGPIGPIGVLITIWDISTMEGITT